MRCSFPIAMRTPLLSDSKAARVNVMELDSKTGLRDGFLHQKNAGCVNTEENAVIFSACMDF